jgi:ATP-dependent DNA ligase
MLYAFSLPTKADKVPTGSDWLHEVKYDGCSSAIRIACG